MTALRPGNGDPPDKETPTSTEAQAGAGCRVEPSTGGDNYAPRRDERKVSIDGSWSPRDPDRPKWDLSTILEQVYDYYHEDRTYGYSVLKGRRADNEKTFLRGRLVRGSSDRQIAHQERELYQWRGLEDYRVGTGDEPNLLYRLPEFIAERTDRPSDTVFICEGEKDVETLRAQGLIATTNSNGALNWDDDFNHFFAECEVAVMVDNDAKGRQRGTRIGAALNSTAQSVKLIELPGLAPGGDVSDWLAAGRTVEGLLECVRETERLISASQWQLQRAELAKDQNGKPYRTLANARIVLARLGVTVRYDQFADRYLIWGLPGLGPVLDDAALTRTRLLTEEEFHLHYGKDRWADIVTDQARRQSFHPVLDYLSALEWDRFARLDCWLVDYAGAEDNEYVRAVGAICLIAAVRRVRQPGSKFDEMLVIESPQGLGKSTALSILAVHEDWFADDLPLDSDSKVVMERTAGRWLIELAELKGMRRGAVEHVKSMVSRRVDKARMAYGRMTKEQPRQCVFFGTTNDNAYLRDMTGNRRFWPVKVEKFDLAALRRDRDQLWAEAAHREAAGESIRLPENLWAWAGDEQSGREIGDPFYELLSPRLDGLQGKVRATAIWSAVGLSDPKLRTQDHNMRLSAVMQKLGWARPKGKLRFDRDPQHAWVKGEPELGGGYAPVDLKPSEM